MFNDLRTRAAKALLPKSAPIRQMDQSLGSAFMTSGTIGGVPPRLGTRQLLESYSHMPWLRATVNKVSHSVSTTNWHLFAGKSPKNGKFFRNSKIQHASFEYRKALIGQDSKKGELEEIKDHPLLDLLHRGNPILLGRQVMQVTQQHVDLAGEAFWLLERNAFGVPVAIWPIPPHWVMEFPRREHPFYRLRIGNEDKDIPTTEIVPFIDPNPADPYSRGAGVARALGDELETDEYAAKHLKGFFLNRARPDIIVSADNLRREETRRLEEFWLEKHGGFWNSFKPFFASRKLEVKELGQSFDNMQMTQLRKHERDTVMQVFGLPPEKLGVLSASNRSTIDAADLFFTKDVIMPRVEMLRSIIQEKLIPYFDERLILDFESPIIEDKEHHLKVMQAWPAAFTINEWRAEAGLPSLGDEGEKHILRSGELVVNELDETPVENPAQEPPQIPGNEEEEEESEEEEEEDDEEDEDEDEKEMRHKIRSLLRNSIFGKGI